MLLRINYQISEAYCLLFLYVKVPWIMDQIHPTSTGVKINWKIPQVTVLQLQPFGS
jgi:hypothetical protein